MEPAPPDGSSALPEDVLIVEDDPIIALDFEDTVLGLGVKTVRSAGNVARALQLIAERAPDFALLDVGLVREKSFAIAERLDALKIPFVFVTGYGAEVRLPAAFADRPRLAKPYSSAGACKRCSGAASMIGGTNPASDRACVDHSATSARSRNVTVIKS